VCVDMCTLSCFFYIDTAVVRTPN